MARNGAKRILIVDDEQSICEVLSIALRKEGYKVDHETDPRSALERIKAEPFDVVIRYNRGRGINQHRIASLLRAFEIASGKVWIPDEGKSLQGYSRSQFEDTWARYLPAESGRSEG